ncbi:MAG: ThiF family adenylyltransferase [Candidatus Niyogibacteria bacterium]|nr:ThiF family adenylyltransferase [Candidatus Niyogibacteria bacterium]
MIQHDVTHVGLGGIGSWVPPYIAAYGCNTLYLFDEDIVKIHNFSNQNYSYPEHLGVPKVKAMEMKLDGMAQWHKSFNRDMQIIATQKKVDEHDTFSGIVIVAVDSGEARKKIFKACKFNPAVHLYIEAGAAEHIGRVSCLIPHDKDQVALYEKFLRAMKDASGPPPCVSRYMGGQFASVIAYFIYRCAEEEWRPDTLYRSEINYTEMPTLETGPLY